jgi:hypothetical protein
MDDNLLDDRKPNAGSYFTGGLGALGTVELLKNVLELLGVHSYALILNCQV